MVVFLLNYCNAVRYIALFYLLIIRIIYFFYLKRERLFFIIILYFILSDSDCLAFFKS